MAHWAKCLNLDVWEVTSDFISYVSVNSKLDHPPSSIVHGGIDTFFHITVPAVFEGMGVPAHFSLMEAPAQRLQHIETLREHHSK